MEPRTFGGGRLPAGPVQEVGFPAARPSQGPDRHPPQTATTEHQRKKGEASRPGSNRRHAPTDAAGASSEVQHERAGAPNGAPELSMEKQEEEEAEEEVGSSRAGRSSNLGL